MRSAHLIPMVLVQGIMACLFTAPGVAGDVPENLCRVLESIEPGQQREVVLRGIYSKYGDLYDPNEPRCRLDVQSSTLVEFPAGTSGYGRIAELLKKSGRAAVTLRGTLYAARGLSFTKNYTSDVQYLIDFRNNKYGGAAHLFRTKFIVNKIVDAEPVPASTAWAGAVGKPATGSTSLKLLHADLPVYPERARIVGAEGTVVVEFDVKDGAAENPAVVTGNVMLVDATISNVKSWRFKEGASQHVTCTFVYELEWRLSGSDENDVVEARIPYFVRVVAPRDGW